MELHLACYLIWVESPTPCQGEVDKKASCEGQVAPETEGEVATQACKGQEGFQELFPPPR